LKIKICGITNIHDAKYCADLGADAIGFILYDKSKRYVEPGIVKNIVSELPAFLVKVGVFVNENPHIVNSITKEAKLNLVQLHGEESPSYLSEIELPVIKSFRVDKDFDYKILTQYKNCSFLLDSFHTKQYGGTGLKFDWTKIPNQVKNKIILAGGISLENIEFIYKEIAPYAIDISSSVETEPGTKDRNKLNELFEKYNELRNI
jgi:phosphoribosylanthranilate isomerase